MTPPDSHSVPRLSDADLDRLASAAFEWDTRNGHHSGGPWTWHTIGADGRENYRGLVRSVLDELAKNATNRVIDSGILDEIAADAEVPSAISRRDLAVDAETIAKLVLGTQPTRRPTVAADTLTDSEHQQLRTLKRTHDNPMMTGIWHAAECERLVELGYAERHEAYPDIWTVRITQAGIEALGV